MKVISTIIFALLVHIGFAQSGNDAQGPASKNYKAWKDNSRKATPVNIASASDKYEEGAKAKNTNPIANNVEVTVYPQSNLKRGKGANAKNRRFFSKSASFVNTSEGSVIENDRSTKAIIQKR